MTRAYLALRETLDDEGVRSFDHMLRRSFEVEALDQDSGGIAVRVRDDLPPAELHRSLKRIWRASRYDGTASLFRREVADTPDQDPQHTLEAKGDVRRMAPGLFALSGDFLRVRDAIDACVKSLAATFGAAELSYPPLWPVPVLQGINYLHDFPHLVMMSSGVAPDFRARTNFAERFRKNSGVSAIACTPENGIAAARAVLAPTVCDCCYWLLRERRDVADQMLTVHGQVFRNESSPDARLDRLTAFTMRELVVIGAEDYVLARRAALIDAVAEMMAGLDLACEIKAADDPFFCNDALFKKMLQKQAKLKYEVEVPLFGGRTTAVASINLHRDFFSRNYDYLDRSGAHPFSACVGFGHERLAYALFCRHGAELAAWPGEVRDYLGLEKVRASGHSPW